MLRTESSEAKRVEVAFPAWINGRPMPNGKSVEFISIDELEKEF